MANKRLALIEGASTSGSAHSLLVEEGIAGETKLTITGADGKKRHASVVLTEESIAETIKALQSARRVIRSNA